MTGRRPWSEEDIAKLKSLAGRRPAKDIAVALGRSVEATVVAASKLKLSLRTRFDFGRIAYGRAPNRFGHERSTNLSMLQIKTGKAGPS